LDQPETLRSGTECRSQLIHIPTGLGKTAAVVLAWLWNRVHLQDRRWPRRLVYCLPMRTLVEQTRAAVKEWLDNLRRHADALGLPTARAELEWLVRHSPVVLMGGEDSDPDKKNWDIYPEKPCILIGTQDMLLSRALNRGYGMSRYRWPMHFALLNNDCLWVLDEIQLMGPGLSTACQLEAFRRMKDGAPPEGFGSFGAIGSATWYMSATHNPDLLQTREWRKAKAGRPTDFKFGLTDGEKSAAGGPVGERRNAVKRLELCKEYSFGNAKAEGALTDRILEQHGEMMAKIGADLTPPPRTLIICNTVGRAVEVYRQLEKTKPKQCDLLLLHSRFRPHERREQVQRLESLDRTAFPEGQIVVATQVIEAGVDISSGVLWSEVAPLASLVQRLGRLNRAGEFNKSAWKPLAVIVGVGVEGAPPREKKEAQEKREGENKKRCLPYPLSACEEAWKALESLGGNASPANLEQIQHEIARSIPNCPYSLQRHELLDFFDTDANLSLGFTDVSPFVRGLDEDTDIQVCWREAWPMEDGSSGVGKPDFTADFQHDELCSVPISKAKQASDVLNEGWIWRGKQSGWISVRDAGLAPGMTILLPLTAGGYNTFTGWTGNSADKGFKSRYQPADEPADEDLLSSLESGWRSIPGHTSDVEDELRQILVCLLPNPAHAREREALLAAVRWHDLGKSHRRWRWAALRALLKADVPKDRIRAHLPLAKFSLSESPLLRGQTGGALRGEIHRLRRLFRPGIAHEVASALAFRQFEQERLGASRDKDLASLLAEYLIMSHHGRVRKVLRDELPSFPSQEKDTRAVRGVCDGDPLPPVVIGGQSLGCAALLTDCRKMGRAGPRGHESYTRGVLRLLDCYGPIRLAFFEAVFRAADARASRRALSAAQSEAAPSAHPHMELREEQPPYVAEPPLSPEERALVAELVADGLSIQDKFRPEPLYKETGKGHYASDTVEEIQRARKPKAEGGPS